MCSLCGDIGFIPVSSPLPAIAFCECYYVASAQRIMAQAPAPIRRALSGIRIIPELPYRTIIPQNFPAKQATPSVLVEGYGFRMDLQEAILATLRENPLKGYAYYGATGVGKSFLMWAQAQEAAYAGMRVIFRTAAQYIEGMRLSQTADEIHPLGIVLPDELQKGRTFLFIDEMDNISTTEFALRKMFELADCCWQNIPALRLSFASNLGPAALKEKLGAATMRRFEETVSGILGLMNPPPEETAHE